MPDLICPPPWTPQPCSCRGLRYGVALLTTCVYSAAFSTVFFGKPLAAVVADALRGDVPIVWTACALFGLLCLGGGLYQIRRDGHGFKAGSFVWSCGVVAACAWRLTNYPAIGSVGWFGVPFDVFGFHFARMLLVAWMASNAANIALNLFEVFGRRERAAPGPLPVRRLSGLLHSHRVTTIETIVEVEGHGIEAALEAARNAARHVSPGLIEDGGDVPLIDYVPDENGDFIPVMPPARVPVRRR